MNIDFDIERKKKKQKIKAVYGAIILTFVVLGIFWITPGVSCTDGKKNGVETGVDCGGICGACAAKVVAKDVRVQKTDFVALGNNSYDAVVWLENPNDVYGARSIQGTFLLYGGGQKFLGEVKTNSIILPREQKFIVSQGISGSEPIESIEWKMTSTEWIIMNEMSDLRLSITDRKYEELTSGSGFSKVSGLLRNDSLYDWNNVVVSVLLFDFSGKLLATHGTSRQTFRSGEKWDFQLIFPIRFSGEVQNITMQTETNVYDNANFIKANLPGGEFNKL